MIIMLKQQKTKMASISDNEIKDYLKATNNQKSYLIVDWEKTNLSVNKFIYIADNFEELRKRIKKYD